MILDFGFWICPARKRFRINGFWIDYTDRLWGLILSKYLLRKGYANDGTETNNAQWTHHFLE